MDDYDLFIEKDHLKPGFDKKQFDALHGWDFGWAVLETINIASSEEDDKELSKRFSPGQKALYFFWYLDAQVTNGGFIQFYWNGYRKYLKPILNGAKLIGDNELVDILTKADLYYLANIEKFQTQLKQDNFSSLYKELEPFEVFDANYFKIHDTTMELLEEYTRQNTDQFFNLK